MSVAPIAKPKAEGPALVARARKLILLIENVYPAAAVIVNVKFFALACDVAVHPPVSSM